MKSTGRFNLFFKKFKRFLPLLQNLTERDIKLKYRRSILGIAWSVLNPLLMMLVITQVFGLLLKIKVENFPVYYIVGVAMWNFFSDATFMSLNSVIDSAPLIKKVYIPKYIFPLEKCMFALINFLFSLIAVVIVMLFQSVVPSWTIILFWVPILYCFVFAIGVSLILSALSVYFRDLLHLYSVVLTIWMYATPIIYPVSLVKGSTLVYNIIRCNPMYYYVEYFRSVVMYGIVPDLTWNLICVTFSVGFFILGVFVFNRAQRNFILYI
ncbi:MAG: ABC transporter permease [Eubacteriales bacterium SKADARSKE-1]|nr:ABC transporter permease [Eubacteriales bacterium SKADARSKE-1]